MSSKNLSFTIEKVNELPDFRDIIPAAIVQNALDFLNPPIKNIGYKGIEKTGREIFRWYKTSKNIRKDFQLQSVLMEKAGTGGALFRNLFRDFLFESSKVLQNKRIERSSFLYTDIAQMWNSVSVLFHKVGESKDIEYLKQASDTLKIIADKEKEAMEILEHI